MVEEALTASVVGCLAFPVALALQQKVLYAPLRITSDRRIAGPLLGFGSVFVSGCCASLAAVAALKGYRAIRQSRHEENLWLDELPTDWQNLIACGLGSALVFRILRGRFHSVLPSSITKHGAFARVSIPARRSNAFSASARERLHKIGKKYGCHTCGRRWRVNKFHRDHQPPTALVKEGQKQVYYPQCPTCSALQGGAISQGVTHVVTHGRSLRLYHLWLPVPLVWLGLKYVYSEEQAADSSTSTELKSPLKMITEVVKSQNDEKIIESNVNEIVTKREVVTIRDDKVIEDDNVVENDSNKAVMEASCDAFLHDRMEDAKQLKSKEDIENIHIIIRIIAVAAVAIVWLFRPE